MKNFDCYEYCKLNLQDSFYDRSLFSQPTNDYFNDNLDQFYDEDDYFDYTNDLEGNVDLEEKTYTHSHPAFH
jgi:hypothetical protein